MRIFVLIFLISTFILSSCDFRPDQKSIKEKIVGQYCAGNYQLTLTDSNTYRNVKMDKGTHTGTPYEESCSGKYSIMLKEGHWVIHFEKAKTNQSMSDCQQEYTLWTEKEGFLVGEKEVIMRDLFDNTALKKGNCK
jgi:hypothetical protein